MHQKGRRNVKLGIFSDRPPACINFTFFQNANRYIFWWPPYHVRRTKIKEKNARKWLETRLTGSELLFLKTRLSISLFFKTRLLSFFLKTRLLFFFLKTRLSLKTRLLFLKTRLLSLKTRLWFLKTRLLFFFLKTRLSLKARLLFLKTRLSISLFLKTQLLFFFLKTRLSFLKTRLSFLKTWLFLCYGYRYHCYVILNYILIKIMISVEYKIHYKENFINWKFFKKWIALNKFI